MRYIRLAFIAILIFALWACGSKKGPTGGEEDLQKPTVLSSSPLEMGDISSGIIEIDFDKLMDKSSLPNAIYFYPPISKRSISLTRQTLRIEIKEDLLPDTNYYITLSERLTDTRSNALDKAHTLVFSHGKAQQGKLSGLINYELKDDALSPIKLSLFSADSLLVMMDELSGTAYEIPNLNLAPYLLRAYIDKNLNGRYDESVEPFFEGTGDVSGTTTMDLNLAYTDTTWAQIRYVKQHSQHELEISFSEPIRDYANLNIQNNNTNESLSILHKHLSGNTLLLLTAATDSTEYTIKMSNLEDLKGTISPASSMLFMASSKADSTPPRLISSTPRNGATINSLRPELILEFSEIISTPHLKAKIMESDSKQEVPLKINSVKGRTVSISPTQDLNNYRSHTLLIETSTSDYSGNGMENPVEILFLPLSRR